MNRQILIEAADAILWVHVAIIAFNLFGLVAIPLGAWRAWRFVRIFWWRALHLGALAVVALQAVLGRTCFLTSWEGDLLSRAGEVSMGGPLIQRWVSQLVFWSFPLWVFAALYVGVCVYTLLLWWFVPPEVPWRLAPSE
jgi:hypothetical protein